ncbi:hypothetical protein MSG28_004392 [Choristoneura fumiferana]|uniref:Uncharacterized protein n=1 Tax=Choristoneura fumiferana TaxID=7141 RepID=A0ACC0KJ74_CHOFU|nr:hypothetical protein MSG28_004392 [Choristoneura fumiferana]
MPCRLFLAYGKRLKRDEDGASSSRYEALCLQKTFCLVCNVRSHASPFYLAHLQVGCADVPCVRSAYKAEKRAGREGRRGGGAGRGGARGTRRARPLWRRPSTHTTRADIMIWRQMIDSKLALTELDDDLLKY